MQQMDLAGLTFWRNKYSCSDNRVSLGRLYCTPVISKLFESVIQLTENKLQTNWWSTFGFKMVLAAQMLYLPLQMLLFYM